MRANNILDTIGSTPHLRINRLYGSSHEVWIKLERANPGGSIKDRIGVAMIEDAEHRGLLKAGSTIIEPTSGNTGIGLAIAAAVKGYRLILVMPESNSLERRRLMVALGATLVLTPKEQGITGSITKARELAAATPQSWVPMQFENPANVEAHRTRTAAEIVADFPDGFDALVTGVGTGGHITGVGSVLRARFPKLKVCAVEPDKSPVLSGGTHSPHKIQGIGTGFVPAVLDRAVVNEVVQVSDDEAFEYARRAAREEGLLVGPSSGATLAAIGKVLRSAPKGFRVIGFCYDTGERYLSVDGLFPQS